MITMPCKYDPEQWFVDGISRDDAHRLCLPCPPDVRTACKDLALALGVKHGVWGGINFASDKARRRAARPPEPKPALVIPDAPPDRYLRYREVSDRLIAAGYTMAVIARHLGISVSTLRDARRAVRKYREAS